MVPAPASRQWLGVRQSVASRGFAILSSRIVPLHIFGDLSKQQKESMIKFSHEARGQQ
jgi:hypothetical protein